MGALNATFAETDVETAIYTISDFVYSLNATAVAVSLLDFYTNAEVNGSLLLEPDCPYNVTFEGEEATAYLGRPWLAIPTVSTAAETVATGATTSDGVDGGGVGNSSSSNSSSSYDSAGNLTTIDVPLTPWQAGGTRQSFGRQGGTRTMRVVSVGGSIAAQHSVYHVGRARSGRFSFQLLAGGVAHKALCGRLCRIRRSIF